MTNIKNLSASAELSSIVRRLVLYSSFMSNCGLLNGKMGAVLFFSQPLCIYNQRLGYKN